MVYIEVTGGLIIGGDIAGAVEKSTGHAVQTDPGTCSDCGEPVTANFCANCGQPTHMHRSLLHLGEELLHGVMHFDARIWRTLPLLLLNPGKLTREWIHGKRTRYVSPLAIFLFTVFVIFFVMSFGGVGIGNPPYIPLPERIASAEADLVSKRAAVAGALTTLTEAQAAAGTAKPPDAERAQDALEAAQGDFAAATADVATKAENLVRLQRIQASGPRSDGLELGSWQADVADAVHEGKVRVGFGDKKLQEKVLHKLANPDFAFYKVQQTVYKFAFLLIPLSIPFVWLLFAWKPGFTWYDHGVFVLYSLTFMAILFMGLAVIDAIADRSPRWMGPVMGFVAVVLMLAAPPHMFAQLRGTYGLSIFSALWRTFALLIFCSVAITLFVVIVILLGLGS